MTSFSPDVDGAISDHASDSDAHHTQPSGATVYADGFYDSGFTATDQYWPSITYSGDSANQFEMGLHKSSGHVVSLASAVTDSQAAVEFLITSSGQVDYAVVSNT